MKLRELFLKPVDRYIEGVIKADDEVDLQQEVEEYVLTNEVEKRLELFLDAYNGYQGANGVWVSGFFGSGKSHLLKMLSLLLEDKHVNNKSVLEMFLSKCGDNEMLKGELKRAAKIPSRSILFNIDQKSDAISKQQTDAVLSVFVKVFDEMCGYYGKQGYIAQFERDMDSRGIYDDFKKVFEEVSGRPWQQGREQALLEKKNVAEAYASVTGEDASTVSGILQEYRNDYKLSIEDFAGMVKDYIDRQSPDFRLNFFVDEVGQYIADHTKLMTNLQTIAESLATKCEGRAWILVTAQEEIDKVIGDLSEKKQMDFSKIQARFQTRMKLTSADVAEVIQKRLLTKTPEGENVLSEIYDKHKNNFKTLFTFTDGSRSFRNFQDEEHFLWSYPFIPYQFELFQSAIENLSGHNAFEGRHSSVGERSMLGVFQQVAIKISDYEPGQIATYDLMFEGIRTALKSHIQTAIVKAENNLDNPFAVKVLKALFLVKYVKEFKATRRNVSVLMMDHFDQDISALEKQVEEALNILEQQTYIRRSGDFYEYLTDEEKDVEQEIKNTDVEASDVESELDKLIFDQVVGSRKIRYERNEHDYPFSRKLDERLHGREHELSIHVISPFHEHTDKLDIHRNENTFRDELRIVMPPDDRLVRDLTMYKQTDKYVRQNISMTQQDTIRRILEDKRSENRERYADLQSRVEQLLEKATYLVAGTELEFGRESAQIRVVKAFQELVHRVYPNLQMLRGVVYKERDIAKHLSRSQEGLFGTDAASLSEPEQEMMAFIKSNSRSGIRTTLKLLVENFEKKPYGWYLAAIQCILASLCARGKVDLRRDSDLLEDEDLERALTNTQYFGNIILEPQDEFTPSQIRSLKEFYQEFFDQPPESGEARALGKETAQALHDKYLELQKLHAEAKDYPFAEKLYEAIDQIKQVVDKRYDWYLKDFGSHREELLDLKEDLLDPVGKFISGSQKQIFDNARDFLVRQQNNFDYASSGQSQVSESENDIEELKELLREQNCFRNNRMQQVKRLQESLDRQVTKQIESEITAACQKVEKLREKLMSTDEYQGLSDDQKAEMQEPFDQVIGTIEDKQVIAVIRETVRNFEEERYGKLLSRVSALSQQNKTPSPQTKSQGRTETGGTATASPAAPSTPAEDVDYTPVRTISVPFEKPWLASEDDVEEYVKNMRDALIKEIREGKRIQI